MRPSRPAALLAATLVASAGTAALLPGVAGAAEPVPRDLATSVTETFDSLAASGTSDAVPAGVGFVETGSNANTTYSAGTGSANAGDTLSLGTSGERAFGGLASASLMTRLGFAVRNTTGAPLTGVTVGYTGEQWRSGDTTNVPDVLDFAYAVNPTSLTGTFTDVNELDFTSPAPTAGAGALNGNADANRRVFPATQISGFSVPAGGVLVLRWSDPNNSGADDALAIDDLTITVSNDDSPPPPPPPGDCSATDTPVGAVQGTGAASPARGSTVTVQGVVTRLFGGSSTAANNGYYLQDAGDGNDASSDGIFVSGEPRTVGEVVQVTGTADEPFDQTAIVNSSSQVSCSTGSPLPAPVDLTLPVSDTGEFERREGMRVRFPQTLLVNEARNTDNFGEVRLADIALQNPTDVAEPGAPAQAVATSNARRQILLDDGTQVTNPRPVPYIPAGGTLRRGQTTSGLTGVLGFAFGAYRVQPTDDVQFGAGSNPRENSPGEVGGFLRVSSYNVLNYFTTLNSRGAQNATDFEEQEAKIVAGIRALGVDAVALQEIENNQATLDTLVAALNEGPDPDVWAGVPFPSNLSTTDVITTAIVYRSDRLTRVGESVAGANPVNNRDPVAQQFQVSAGVAGAGERFTVVSNHLKSKGGTGTGDNADTGDGQGAFNGDRVRQAQFLVGFINNLRQAEPDVISLGDYNAYTLEDPIDVLRQAGLIDVGQELVPLSDRYSFVFSGEQGVLDHAIVTPELFQKITGADHWHPNADEPDLLEYGTANNGDYYRPDAFRASDHDPLVVGIGPAGQVGPAPVVPEVPYGALLPVVALATVGVVVLRRRKVEAHT